MILTRRDFFQSAAVTGIWLAASKAGMAGQAAAMSTADAAAAAKHADVIVNHQISLEMLKDVPKIPSTSPPDWRVLAERVNSFLMNPANGALRTDSQGVKYFRTVVEEENRELITLGCVVAGKMLRGDDVREFTPALGAFYNRDHGLFLNNVEQHGIEYWYLYYNPYAVTKTVVIHVGNDLRDLYDSVPGDFILQGATGSTAIPISADSAIVLVLVPTDGTSSRDGHSLLVNGTVIDYRKDRTS